MHSLILLATNTVRSRPMALSTLLMLSVALPHQGWAQAQSTEGAAASTQTGKQATKATPAASPKQAALTNDEQIEVKAQRQNRMEVKSGGNLGALGNKKGLDVPFNVRSYTSALILNQQSQTLGEVLMNDPTVRTTYGYGNFSEQFIIRGFPVYGDDVAIDGLYGITPRQLVSPQLYDQVQVLNGASAFLNGAAPGGTAQGGNINLEFKHAGDTPLTRVTGDYTSSSMGGGAVDVGRRFGQDKQFGVRINVAGRSGVSAIDREKRHQVAVGGGFDWHDRSERTRVTVDMAYENQGVNGGRGGVFLSGVTSVPKVPGAGANYGQPWTYTELNYIYGKLKVEHDFGKYLTAYAQFGGLGGNEKGNYGSTYVTNSQTGAGYNGAMYVPYVQTNESTQAGLRSHFHTGGIKHEINAGGSGLWEENASAYALALTRQQTNLYHPTLYNASQPETYIGGNIDNPQKNNTTRLWSLFFSDTVSAFHDRVALTAGFRYQSIKTVAYNYGKGTPTGYDQGAFTPVVGLVVHPTHQTSIYFNRIEGLAPGPQASGQVVNLGQIFPPYQTVQYELGAKYDIGRFSTSVSIFQIDQPNSYTVAIPGTGTSIFSVDGLQRNRGIEFTVNGEIFKGLRFNGGTSIIDADQRRTSGGLYDGKRAIGVPGYTINGNLEYDLPFIRGATVTGRVIQTGHQYANNLNTLRVPNWTRFDVGARYSFVVEHKAITTRLGVDNLANSRYWESAFGGYLLQGLPRTFKFSVTADF
ncbi:ferrichrome siderophore receptor FcuA [Asaia krungthepensis NRIC 0535]|uniref:Ferrichrome siderophore receptor FcuA n=2 Tax=Asaia krungthepensis TaxID=220990 RepID=A0ABQ0PY81_9PROT|nr:ferrichrome siderophore receptor FcuA [Asaia krungthepensis NRIC 0535]